MLTSFAAADVLLPDVHSTMDAATIAEREREGGGAASQRRPAEERSWKGLVNRFRLPLVLRRTARYAWRLGTKPA
jgi:hypothetical protein